MEGLIWAIAILLALAILLVSAWSLVSSARRLAGMLSGFIGALKKAHGGKLEPEVAKKVSQLNDDPAKHLLARSRLLRDKRLAEKLRTRRLIERLKSR